MGLTERGQGASSEVRVWRIDLDVPAPDEARLAALLSTDERAKTETFRFDYLRRRYVVARAALRQLLAALTGADPTVLQFTYGPHGKPALAGGLDQSRIGFNVSHSDDLALIAIAHNLEVGVDVERVRRLDDPAALAEGVLTPAERTMLAALTNGRQSAALLRLWTRKEALAKAAGGGLALPLDQIDVTQSRAALDDREWRLSDLDPGAGHVGCVAVECSKGREPPLPATAERWVP